MVDTLQNAISNSLQAHPRLLYTTSAIDSIKQKISQNTFHQSMADFIISAARSFLHVAPLERIVEGRRLLTVSRHYLKRIHFLSVAFQLTGEVAFVEKVQEEMLSAIAFSDWNPSHMLDVGEMCAAVALGYDLLFHELDDDVRAQIRHGIKTLGLEAMDIDSYWVEGSTNWNPVCHGGCVLGSLAIIEDEPELAERLINRAIKNVPLALAAYEPEGAHPEGPMYWGYGTGYAVILIAALESALQSDFGLLQHQGFTQTGRYFLQATGNSGLFFNYADCRLDPEITPAIFWFAQRFDDPSLLWNQVPLFKQFIEKEDKSAQQQSYQKHLYNDQMRLFPLMLLWSGNVDAMSEPSYGSCAYSGETPISILRTGWQKTDAYVGIKAGSPSGPHGHMDVGSFVYEYNGIRWAHDLGLQEYHELEEHGIVLWDKAQDGDRWKVHRLSNFLHNCLVVNGALQSVDGHAEITRFNDGSELGFAQMDLSSCYPALKSAQRGFALSDDGALFIRDEVQTASETAQIRWSMLSYADIELIDAQHAVLHQDDQVLYLSLITDDNSLSWELFDSATAPNDWDNENPGTCMIGFTAEQAPQSMASYAVFLHGEQGQQAPSLSELRDW